MSAISNKKIRLLSDVTNAGANKEVIQALKEFATFTLSNNLVEKECVVGITGLQKVLLSSINLFAKSKLEIFDNVDKAKEWLAS